MFHGWQDNAGTFDTLIPKLPKHVPYLAIDFPGHGLSSQIPNGMIYSSIQFINIPTYVRDHFGWDKISFCSHSLGAQISFLYATLYPDDCDLLVSIDAILKPSQGDVDNRTKRLASMGRDFIKLDKLNCTGREPPSYLYDECIDRWVKSSTIDHKTAPYLMKRGALPSKIDPNKFYFTRDLRLKMMDFGLASLPDDLYYGIAKRIVAPHLYIRATKAAQPFEGAGPLACALEVLTASNPKFEWFEVDAPHHCHLTQPEVMSKQISEFITKYRSPFDSN